MCINYKVQALIIICLFISILSQFGPSKDHSTFKCDNKEESPELVPFNCLIRELAANSAINHRCCWVKEQKDSSFIKETRCEQMEYNITLIEKKVKDLQSTGSTSVDIICSSFFLSMAPFAPIYLFFYF